MYCTLDGMEAEILNKPHSSRAYFAMQVLHDERDGNRNCPLWLILGDPGAASRDEGIFVGESFTATGRRAPGHLVLLN